MDKCPHPSIRRRLRIGVSNLPNRCSSWTHLAWRTVCPIVCGTGWDWWNDDELRRWQVDQWRWNEPVTSRADNQQNCDWNEWGHWNASIGWHWWSSCSTRGDERWASWSPWSHPSQQESKKHFDKSPPPEWDGSQPVKTWRDYRRMLKRWLSTTDVPLEKHGMLLWRALAGDAKLLISHFRDEELLRWDASQRIFDVFGPGSQAYQRF